MGHKGDVTEWQKGAIVFGPEHCHSLVEMARFVGLSESTVSSVHLQWKKNGNDESRRSTCRRKSIMTNRDLRRLDRLAMGTRFQTRQKLLQDYNAGPSQQVSERTL